MYEYLQQNVPLNQLGPVCNVAALDDWRLLGMVPAMAQVNGGIMTPTSGGVMQIAICIFERKRRCPKCKAAALDAVPVGKDGDFAYKAKCRACTWEETAEEVDGAVLLANKTGLD